MIRNIIAVVVAFVVGGIFVMGLEMLGHKIYPIPEGMDRNDFKRIAEYVKTASIGALLFVLLAQSAGSFMGGLVTALIAASHHRLLALIYGVLALVMASITVIMIKHPTWMTVAALALPIPLALLGSMIGQMIRPKANSQFA